MSTFNVALVQIASPSLHPDLEQRKQENLAKMLFYIDLISMENPLVDMITFPELYLPGVDMMNWHKMAETIPGPLTDALCAKAKEVKKWLIPGSMFEDYGVPGHAYNTSMLISPEGEIVMTYRKVFIPCPLEPSTPGTNFPVYEIPNVGKIGIMICADCEYPEAGRMLALKGAEVIIKPTLQPVWIGGLRNNMPIMITRAVENACFFLTINQPNPDGMGHSGAVDPEGRILEELGDCEAFTVVYLDLDQVRRVREQGSFGLFSFFKMLKAYKEAGAQVDECYLNGIENAPLYETLKTPFAQLPTDVQRWDSQTGQCCK